MQKRLAVLCLSAAICVCSATAEGAEFHCASGDVACLIAAINQSNGNGEANTIHLDAGTYRLTQVFDGSNGLPLITGTIAIVGRGAHATVIERDPTAPQFRFFEVRTSSASLTLEGVTLRGGRVDGFTGRRLHQQRNCRVEQQRFDEQLRRLLWRRFLEQHLGTVTIRNSAVTHNSSSRGGGFENNGGMVSMVGSILANNSATSAGGGWFGGGQVLIVNSTISGNVAGHSGGGMFYFSSGETNTLTIRDSAVTANSAGNGGGGLYLGVGVASVTNATFSGNGAPPRSAQAGGGGAIFNQGTLTLTSVTVAHNFNDGIVNFSGVTKLKNTILASNSFSQDFSGDPVTSLGHNLLGSAGCANPLMPTDLIGHAEGFQTGTTRPGDVYVRLVSTSRAIDAGDAEHCTERDQRGLPRQIDGNGDGTRVCDIGAAEFYPVVNNRLRLEALSHRFETPSNLDTDPRASAGTYQITATFQNSGPDICQVLFDVTTLNGPAGTNPVLLTPDSRAPGRTGRDACRRHEGRRTAAPAVGRSPGVISSSSASSSGRRSTSSSNVLGDATSGPCVQ